MFFEVVRKIKDQVNLDAGFFFAREVKLVCGRGGRTREGQFLVPSLQVANKLIEMRWDEGSDDGCSLYRRFFG